MKNYFLSFLILLCFSTYGFAQFEDYGYAEALAKKIAAQIDKVVVEAPSVSTQIGKITTFTT